MCDVYFIFLAVGKSCGCAALSSSWNCRDQPVWPDRCFDGHRKKPPRGVHRSRYFRVWLFTLNIDQAEEVCSVPSCCSWFVEVSLSQNNPELHHFMSASMSVLWTFTSADMKMPQYMNEVFEWTTWKDLNLDFYKNIEIVVLLCSKCLHFTFYLMCLSCGLFQFTKTFTDVNI